MKFAHILTFFSVLIYKHCGVTTTFGNIQVYGPGLKPKEIIMPARYFFINSSLMTNNLYSETSHNIAVEIKGLTKENRHCRAWTNLLNRKDGTYIVRYKLYDICDELIINIYFKNKHIENSPFVFKGPILVDQCFCPEESSERWMKYYDCKMTSDQIIKQLKPFNKIIMKNELKKIIKKLHRPESTSFCHYIIKQNELYRDCYGKHVGFNMFSDNILLSILRKVKIPDIELVINLGDWPLVNKNEEVLPIFSWCGNNENLDIVLPTYDITESTLENMGRVTLDTLSVQGNIEKKWEEREPSAIWRGRDSRIERLKLIDIARANPQLINASLTNFFFFREKEDEYGPKVPHISFFKFFDYKYQINVDGTVAAYRFPYLLAGGGLVLKQESPYYEHFYAQLKPWEHYVPIKSDLSDLVTRIEWARNNDDKAQKIAENARKFANENLLPQHIICYHALLLTEWAKKLEGEVTISEGMTHVPQPKFECPCASISGQDHTEL